MKKIIGLCLIAVLPFAYANEFYTPKTPVHVHGYTKKDGTYVNPYYRSKPHHHSSNNADTTSDTTNNF